MNFNTDTLMWVLAQAEPAKKGLLSGKVIVIVVAVILVAGLIYWYRGRGGAK